MRPVSEPWLSDSGVKTAWLTDSPQKQSANRVVFPLTLTDHFAFSVLHRRQRRNDEAADRVRRQRQCRGFGKMDAVTCSRNLRPFAPRQIFDQQVRLSRWPRHVPPQLLSSDVERRLDFHEPHRLFPASVALGMQIF